jgi:hypothetical protein
MSDFDDVDDFDDYDATAGAVDRMNDMRERRRSGQLHLDRLAVELERVRRVQGNGLVRRGLMIQAFVKAINSDQLAKVVAELLKETEP